MNIDIKISSLIALIAVICGLIFLCLIAIILFRFRRNRLEQRYQKESAQWKAILNDYLNGNMSLEETVKQFPEPINYNRLWRFMEPIAEASEEAMFLKTYRFCDSIGLIQFFRRDLGRRAPLKKAMAVRVLGSLKCMDASDQMLQLLQSRQSHLILAAAQGLVALGDPQFLIPVTKALLQSTYFTYEGAASILLRFNKGIVPSLIQLLEERIADPQQKPDSLLESMWLDLLGNFQSEEAVPLLTRLSVGADDELLIHILKAIVRIGEAPSDLDLDRFLSHPHWVVRNFAAQIGQFYSKQETFPVLVELLSDAHWWVRYHAAMALSRQGSDGKAFLQDQLASGSQRSADISRYVLAIGEVTP